MKNERAYIIGHFALRCPSCGGMLVEVAPADDFVMWTAKPTVQCVNGACPEHLKKKQYTRPHVELNSEDSQPGS